MKTINSSKNGHGLTKRTLVPLCIFYPIPTNATVSFDVYISVIVDIFYFPPYYSTDTNNYDTNELKEFGIIFLDPINLYFTTIKISSNLPKIAQGFT